MSERSEYIGSLIGKPYEANAKGPDKYDCWSAVAEVRRGLYGDVLPTFEVPEDPSLLWLAHQFQDSDERRNWKQVVSSWAPKDGSLVLMSRAKSAIHIGIWLAEEKGILHAVEVDGIVFQDVLTLKACGWGNLRYFERLTVDASTNA